MVLEDVFNLLCECLEAEPLESANYMFGGDSLLRILFTDLVCFRGNKMYEF